MSEASKRARQDRRASERETRVRAIALVRDGGGYRIATLAIPESAVETYALEVTEPEVLSVQGPIAAAALVDGARAELDEEGRPARPRCPSCGAEALTRHPTKPVLMCAACGHREALPTEAVAS